MRGTVVASALAVAVSACGSDKVDGSSVARSAARTRAAGTARFTIDATFQGRTQRFAEGFTDMRHRKPWLFVDTTKLLGGHAADAGPLDQFRDPAKLAAAFAGARNVQRVGSTSVRGAPTTHYKGELDTKQMLGRLPEALRAPIQRIAKDLSATVPVEVWVDAQGRVRRQQFVLAAPGQTAKLTTELYDFGVRHTVAPPRRGQVADYTSQAQLP
jgi:hypothetical protein